MRQRRLLFAGIASCLAVLGAECSLQALARVSSDVDHVLGSTNFHEAYKPLPDERVVSRPNPAHPENDARGFRNAEALKQAAIVALGDSQTQGQGVEPAEAYPQSLARATGLSVYNMAFGGYGPVHGLQLFDEALALAPRMIVFGLYSGNDAVDAYKLVYEHGKRPELRSADEAVLKSIAAAEARGTLAQQVAKSLYGHDSSAFRNFIADHSKIYALLRTVKRKALFRDDWAFHKHQASTFGLNIIFEAKEARTILTPRYRMNALNRHDPRIREGKRIALEAVRAMRDKAVQRGVHLLVLLIPTKELVFKQLVDRKAGKPDDTYEELVSAEVEFWDHARSYFESHQIESVDALPAMRAALHAGSSPYSESHDGHPNATGYRAIARTVQAGLAQRGWLQAPAAPSTRLHGLGDGHR